jgi:hypothetical protein
LLNRFQITYDQQAGKSSAQSGVRASQASVLDQGIIKHPHRVDAREIHFSIRRLTVILKPEDKHNNRPSRHSSANVLSQQKSKEYHFLYLTNEYASRSPDRA